LAVALGGKRRVTLGDSDPQRSATVWWQARKAEAPELVEADASGIVAALRVIRASGAGLAIVDTMPSIASDIGAIARAADLVLIPCRPSILDLRAAQRTVELVKLARTRAAFLPNAVPLPCADVEASLTAEARRALSVYGLPVLAQAIGQRAVLAHALAGGGV